MQKKKTTAFVITLVCIAAIIQSFNLPEKKEGFKNLKVLPKDISKKALDSTMDYFAISLGVRCGHCHARWADSTKRGLDFASDLKPEKSRARDMMKMTASINTSYFNTNHSEMADTIKTVTCYTCHRGAVSPTAKNLLPKYKELEKERSKK
jgi:cytochrome c553